jgi:hypothetical protein
MDPSLLRAFAVQAGHYVQQGLLAVEIVNRGISENTELAWLGIESLVASAASVSRIVWPDENRVRQEVQQHLHLHDDSPLRDRKLRNHFEHVGSRLDEWWRDSPNHNLIDTYIGSTEGIDLGSEYAGNWLRTFDPEANVASFNGHEVDLQVLVDELTRIYPYCSPPWFGSPPPAGMTVVG